MTPEDTALLIAWLMTKANMKRARLSEATVRVLLSKKHTKLRASFIRLLREELDLLGIVLVELDRGGFGVMRVSVLEGVPALLVKEHLSKDEQAELKQRPVAKLI